MKTIYQNKKYILILSLISVLIILGWFVFKNQQTETEKLNIDHVSILQNEINMNLEFLNRCEFIDKDLTTEGVRFEIYYNQNDIKKITANAYATHDELVKKEVDQTEMGGLPGLVMDTKSQNNIFKKCK
jgi:hypothetical protein